MSNADQVARALEKIPDVATLTAQFISANPDGTVNVDFGQGSLPVYSAGFYTPLAGEFIRTLRLNGMTLMLGPVAPRSSYGRITATGTPYLTVLLPSGVEEQLPYMPGCFDPAPAIGQDVLISRADGGMIIGNVSAVPVSDYMPVLTPPTPRGTFSPEFVARDSGNYWISGGTWNKNEVWASPSNTGAWFYNNIAGSIPDSAEILSVQVYVNEFQNSFPNNLTQIGLHSKTGKAGNPAVTSGHPISAGSGWKTLPNSFGDALKTGAALGVGTIASTGLHKYRGRATDASSGRLRIKYSL